MKNSDEEYQIDIIVNPVSGKGAGKRTLHKVEEHLKAKNIKYSVHLLTKCGEGKTVAAELCKNGSSVIAAIGGDGTFHEVLNGMDFTNARLGFVPAGRGNDYAVGAGLSFDPVEAVEKIIAGIPDDRDYIQLGNRRCINVCGTGLDIEVLNLTEKYKAKFSYVKSLIKCLLNYKPYTVSVKVDGQERMYKCVMAAFCNGTQIGGGIKICPVAVNNDGVMDLMVIKEPWCPTIFVMPGFVKGRHMKKSYVEHIKCESARITCLDSRYIELDGEIYEDNVMDAHIVKGGLKTFK